MRVKKDRGRIVTYRTVVVDDDPLFRVWLSSVLDESRDFEVLAEACNGAECIGLLENVSPDVVVLDVNMPDLNGFELAEHIKVHYPGVNIVVVSSNEDRIYSMMAAQQGAVAFIPKSRLSPSALLQALRASPVP